MSLKMDGIYIKVMKINRQSWAKYSLLDKVMSRNQRHIGVQEHHLMFKDPYMVIKRRCVWNKTFQLGQFMLCFTTFIMVLYR